VTSHEISLTDEEIAALRAILARIDAAEQKVYRVVRDPHYRDNNNQNFYPSPGLMIGDKVYIVNWTDEVGDVYVRSVGTQRHHYVQLSDLKEVTR
jgi:hypothetical protein